MSDDLNTPIVLDGLVDARAMALAHPNSFEAPTDADLASIIPGRTWAKICRAHERFWICVTQIDREQLTGFIDNDLVTDANSHLKFRQLVIFEKRHCYEVFLPSDVRAPRLH